MKKELVKNKIVFRGDRNNFIIRLLTNLKYKYKWKFLDKIIFIELWDGYKLHITFGE